MRHSPQPGAGGNANSSKHMNRLSRPPRRPQIRPPHVGGRVLGQNVFAAIMDEANFVDQPWEKGTPVRLKRESSERLANGELLAGTAPRVYGYVVRELKKGGDAVRRSGRPMITKIVVKLVCGSEVVTDPWNLERVTTLDLLAACAED